MPGRGRPFEPGRSGNAGGRPKQDVTVSELARVHGPRAIEVLAELMNDPRASPTARALAAERLLDRGYGRPLNTTATVTRQVRCIRDLTDDELMRIAQGFSRRPAAP